MSQRPKALALLTASVILFSLVSCLQVRELQAQELQTQELQAQALQTQKLQTQASKTVLHNIRDALPDVTTDIRYAGRNNFLGRPAEGYLHPYCLLTPEATLALSRAQKLASEYGFTLLVYDCYRPQSAVNDFVRWVASDEPEPTKAHFYPHIHRSELIDLGYIASRSGHSRASTVDLTLANRSTGEPIDMGTPWDFFDPLSHTDSGLISPEATENRHLLRQIMSLAGFENYFAEWWHYSLKAEPLTATYLDIPIE